MKITIDRGLQSYDIEDADGTYIGTIRFNPGDLGMAGRVSKAQEVIEQLQSGINPDDGADAISKICDCICDQMDYIFGTPVSKVLFANVSPLAVMPDGDLMFNKYLQALLPEVMVAQEAAAKSSAERLKKYTANYQGSSAGLAPEQLAEAAQ